MFAFIQIKEKVLTFYANRLLQIENFIINALIIDTWKALIMTHRQKQMV